MEVNEIENEINKKINEIHKIVNELAEIEAIHSGRYNFEDVKDRYHKSLEAYLDTLAVIRK